MRPSTATEVSASASKWLNNVASDKRFFDSKNARLAASFQINLALLYVDLVADNRAVRGTSALAAFGMNF